jgi:C4-dicarboxylate-specific signal transduction histidine kinase
MEESRELILKGKREFVNSIFLIGVIPFMVFIYIVVSRMAAFKIFIGEVGYIMIATIGVFLSGILVGRKMLWAFIQEVLNNNQKIIEIQSELVEKSRLAAVTETALSLGHEINNPIVSIRGNLVMMENDLAKANVSNETRERLSALKSNFDRIAQATEKMSKLSRPVTEHLEGKLRMVNLGRSE